MTPPFGLHSCGRFTIHVLEQLCNRGVETRQSQKADSESNTQLYTQSSEGSLKVVSQESQFHRLITGPQPTRAATRSGQWVSPA